MTSQRPQGGGILPATTLKSLDGLVDRLNSSSFNSSQINTLALLVGTNEGIPLSRSYGTHNSAQQTAISDEVLSSIETIWATLPSSTPPHVKIDQPPHPLLSHLGLGDQVHTTMAFYEHWTLVHMHFTPAVVTILASTTANIGALKSTALPFLKELLKPVRKALVDIRTEAMNGNGAGVGDAGRVDGSAIKSYFHG
jgi:hypothetical protein|eukprot:46477_1